MYYDHLSLSWTSIWKIWTSHVANNWPHIFLSTYFPWPDYWLMMFFFPLATLLSQMQPYLVILDEALHLSVIFSFLSFFRVHGKHHQFPSGSCSEAFDGWVSTREVPAPHGCRPLGGHQGTGPPRPLQRMGGELFEGDAIVRHHLDVLWSMERYPSHR